QVVDEELAVEVVHLVLDAHGEQAFGIELERNAFTIECAHAHALRTYDAFVEAGHRKAPLLESLRPVPNDDLRIDESKGTIALLRDVRHEDAPVNVDLRRSQTDPGCGIHGFEQVVHELPDFVIHPLHRMCSSSQSGIGVFEYVKYCHNHAAR